MGRKSIESKDEITDLVKSDDEKITDKINELLNVKSDEIENQFRTDLLDFFKSHTDIISKANKLVDDIESVARDRILNDPDSKNSEVISLYKVASENRNDVVAGLIRLMVESRKEAPVTINIANDQYKDIKKEDVQKISNVLDVLESMKKLSNQETAETQEDDDV